jgi:hypothetical protein
MTEDQLLAEVVRLAAARGVLALHVPDRLARQMGPDWSGFPDLCLVGERAVLWAELKADGRAGQLRPAQRQFHRHLVMAGQLVVSWSPAELRSGRIGDVLDSLAT